MTASDTLENGRARGRAGRRLDIAIGGALGLLALLVYLATLSAGAYPGESAELIVRAANRFPKVLPSHPLWDTLAWAFARIPGGGGIAARLNLLSALCGAGAVWLLYGAMRLAIEKAIEPFSPTWERAPVVSRLAGVSSALFLAFCVPFWMVSNRAHVAAFDILLLLVVVRVFLLWLGDRTPWRGALVMFLAAATSAEFATALLALPVLCMVIPLTLWRRGELRAAPLAGCALALVAGWSLNLLVAGVFHGSEGYILRGYTGYVHVVRQMIRMQYGLLARSLPREGWLIVLFVTVVPWLTALAVGRRALNAERDWSYYLLHAMMTALVALVLLNVRVAPWPMLRAQADMGRGRLLVTPYLLAASLFGYLVAYWFLLPASWWETNERRAVAWLRRWFGAILIAPALLTLAVMPFFNAVPANGKQARFANDYAAAVLDAMEGREWLVSDGSVDHQLEILASDRNRRLTILSFAGARSDLYMRYIAAKFDHPRVRNAAQLGLLRMLQEWMASEPGIHERLAVQALPDLWIGQGYTPVPNRLVFLGGAEGAEYDTRRLLAEHDRFWRQFVPALDRQRVESPALAGLRTHMVRHLAFVANNLGVFLEDRGVGEEAFKAYESAREIDPNNVSALLNQLAMVKSGMRPDRAEAVRRDVDDFLKNLTGRYRIWSLSRYYGYVRLPQAFAELGWNWAYSGQPSLAVAGIKKAMELLPEEDRGKMRGALAGIYLSGGDTGASEGVLREMLDANPGDVNALLGMSRVELLRGRPRDAMEYLRQAKDAGAEQGRVALELAGVLAVSGNTARARVILEELVDVEPARTQAWWLLTAILAQERDEKSLARFVRQMREAKSDLSAVLPLAEGHLALMNNETGRARSLFDRMLAANPNSVHALETLLRLDLHERRDDDVGTRVKRLLTIDPANAFANAVRGSIQYSHGNSMLAEDSFRKALETVRSPDVLNDLAWILQERRAYEEAEQLVREALVANGELAGAWDTLGVVLTKTGRTGEAEESLNRALALSPGNPNVHLHLAELYEATGDKDALRKHLDALAPRRNLLDGKQLKRLAELGEADPGK